MTCTVVLSDLCLLTSVDFDNHTCHAEDGESQQAKLLTFPAISALQAAEKPYLEWPGVIKLFRATKLVAKAQIPLWKL